jgi:plasmid maintenance system antidote protein VapI
MMDHDVSYRQLANDTDISTNLVYRLLNGLTPMSVSLAIKLERRTGIKSGNWLRMEYEYQMETAENEELKKEWRNQHGNSAKQDISGAEGAAADE